MKILKYFLFIGFLAQFINAQSNITFSGGSSIDVGLGADICADIITGTVTGDGTQCGSPTLKFLNLVAMIEGFYNGSTMVPDTVTVQVRYAGPPYNLAEQKKIALNSSGSGSGSLASITSGIPYYLVVKHRNSIETWSKSAHLFTGGSLTYDFTTAATQAYGDNMKLNGSKWCIFSGDVDQDGSADLTDMIIIDNDNANFVTGYVPSDVNGDLLTDLSDLIIVDNNNALFVGRVVPPGALAGKENGVQNLESDNDHD